MILDLARWSRYFRPRSKNSLSQPGCLFTWELWGERRGLKPVYSLPGGQTEQDILGGMGNGACASLLSTSCSALQRLVW